MRRWRAAAVGFTLGARPLSDAHAGGAGRVRRRAAEPTGSRTSDSHASSSNASPTARPNGRTRPSSPTYELALTAERAHRPGRDDRRPAAPPPRRRQAPTATSVDAHRPRRVRTPFPRPDDERVTAATPLGVASAATSGWRGQAGLVNDTGDWVLIGRRCRCTCSPRPVRARRRRSCSCASWSSPPCSAPLGGSLVDRWNLRRCLIATNLAQAVMLLPLLAVRPDRIWPAYVAVIGQALLTQLNNPANVALIPRVVEREQLTAANAALAASTSLARLVGAPLGGLLVRCRRPAAPWCSIDLVSFLGVGGGDHVRSRPTPIPIAARRSARRSDPHPIRTGLREIADRPVLRGVVSIGGIAPDRPGRRSSCCSSCSSSSASGATAPTSASSEARWRSAPSSARR